MLKRIQSFFNQQIDTATSDGEHGEHALALATAALLFEVTRADFEVLDVEREVVESAIQKIFSLSEAETRELADLAEREVEEAVSLYQFTGLINQHFLPTEKVRIVEMLWQVVFADGIIACYEEAMVRKIADLIHVPHRDFIQAKHRVEKALKKA
ncbi:MAG: TerB family tellurite resistance protein [Gammaproteobacteria bacterium]